LSGPAGEEGTEPGPDPEAAGKDAVRPRTFASISLEAFCFAFYDAQGFHPLSALEEDAPSAAVETPLWLALIGVLAMCLLLLYVVGALSLGLALGVGAGGSSVLGLTGWFLTGRKG
jgi:hypothetical protein